MGKLIAWDMVTIDGYFEGPKPGELDWFVFDDELERYIIDSQKDAGALVFGRVTYEMMAAYWPSEEGTIAEFMNRVPKLVFSRTMKTADWHNSRVAMGTVPDEMNKLKRSVEGDVFVFGSANLVSSLIKHGLIDEYRIGINPVLLGAGVPLFKGGEPHQKLRVVKALPMKSGVVIMHYEPERS